MNKNRKKDNIVINRTAISAITYNEQTAIRPTN